MTRTRTFAGILAASVAVALLSAGASAPAAELARAPASAGCKAASPGSALVAKSDVKWLIGTWQNPSYTLRFQNVGGTIRWEMLREADPAAHDGLKSAMHGSGTVTGTSPCALEMTGYYDWDEAARLIGMTLNFKGMRDGTDGLSGELYGAALQWTPIQFFKTEPE